VRGNAFFFLGKNSFRVSEASYSSNGSYAAESGEGSAQAMKQVYQK
jgi:hypothetical protein